MSHNELVKILLPNILRNLTSIFKLGSLCGHTATLPLFTAVATAAPLLVAAVVVVVVAVGMRMLLPSVDAAAPRRCLLFGDSSRAPVAVLANVGIIDS